MHFNRNNDRLEMLRGSTCMTDSERWKTYEQMLSDFSLMSVERARDRRSLAETFKFVTGMIAIHPKIYFHEFHDAITTGNRKKTTKTAR